MNKHAVDTIADAALRDLDPALATALTDAERERADATFARILATPSHDEISAAPVRPRRHWSRLLVPVGLAGAAGAAVPAMLGGSALGSWTPTPEPLTSAAADAAATTCRAIFGVPDQGVRVVIAESRGEWTYVLLAGPQAEAACLMPEGLADQEDPASATREGFMGSFTADPAEVPAPARDRIIETGSGSTSVPTNGLWGFRDDEEEVSQVSGYVGSEVTGVTVHTPIGTDVEASVAHGRFAAWWPSAKPSSENLDVMGAWTYTVILVDGSTRRVTG